jgi:hypothetical protein
MSTTCVATKFKKGESWCGYARVATEFERGANGGQSWFGYDC